MPRTARYLTHPQVVIDPDTPIAEWSLSPLGQTRIEQLCAAHPWKATTRIISSGERKAVEAARLLEAAWTCPMEIRPRQHENDRSATGFLPPKEFEVAANAFFAAPDRSYCGWETAQDAQNRILRDVEDCLTKHQEGDLLFVGHGAVGTLLYCVFSGQPIDRRFDQPAGGGSWCAFDLENRRALHHWKRIEDCF